MEKENFLGQHKVFIKSVSVSLVTHLLGLSLFSVAEIRQKPLPSHLRFTLLAIPALWEKTGPLAETTSDLDRADTSLLALTALTQTAGAGSAPKLELFHKQLIWEEEPENMPASPTFSGLAYWTFQKEKADYSLLLRSLNDNPTFLASKVAENLASLPARRRLDAEPGERIELSPSLRRRGVLHKELPAIAAPEARSSFDLSTRLSVAIDSTGAVRHVIVLRSSGVTALDAAALKSLSKWEFTPTPENGDGSSLWGWVQLSFLKTPPEQNVRPSPKASPDRKKEN